MTRSLALTTLLAFIALPAAAEDCEIEGLGGASDYNVVTLGDFSSVSSDVEGKLAVGGNLDIRNFGVNQNYGGSGVVLSVGGNAKMRSSTVYGGDGEVKGSCDTDSTVSLPAGTLSCSDSGAFDASTLADEMIALSAHLGAKSSTHTHAVYTWGGLWLTGTGDEVVYNVDLDAAKAAFDTGIDGFRTIYIGASLGNTVIVNFTGDTDALWDSTGGEVRLLSGGVLPETVIFNFPDATEIEMSNMRIQGSVLAPYAHLDFTNGYIAGTVIVDSHDGGTVAGGQFGDYTFGGEICIPPEGDPCPYDDEDNALGPAGAYNVFTFDGFHGTYSDIEGKTAIGGDAYFKHYGIASGESDGDTVLSVAGDAEIRNAQIYGGDGEVGGTCVTSSLGTPDGTLTCSLGSSVFDAADHEDDLGDLSDYLAALGDTGTTTVYDWGVVDLKAGSDDLQVFNLDLTDISADMAWSSKIYTLNIKADSDQTVLINVTGDTSVMMNSMGFGLSGGVGYEDIVFHYPDATALTVKSVTVPGALFAPKAALAFDWGNIEGTVIASSIKGTGEFHVGEFEGTFCPTPSGGGSK